MYWKSFLLKPLLKTFKINNFPGPEGFPLPSSSKNNYIITLFEGGDPTFLDLEDFQNLVTFKGGHFINPVSTLSLYIHHH